MQNIERENFDHEALICQNLPLLNICAIGMWGILKEEQHLKCYVWYSKKRIKDNCHYLKVVIEVVLFCAKRNIGLWGHRENEVFK